MLQDGYRRAPVARASQGGAGGSRAWITTAKRMSTDTSFRFVLTRGPTEALPQAPLGLAYRAYAPGEYVWVISLTTKGASTDRLARLLGLLILDQKRQILPPAAKSSGPGMGLLMQDGSLRDSTGMPLSPEVHLDVGRIAKELWVQEAYFLDKALRFFRREEVPEDFAPLPESHPIHNPALEQVFAPLAPLLLARWVDVPVP